MGGCSDTGPSESFISESAVFALQFDTRPAGVLLTRLTNDIDSLGEVIGSGVGTLGLDLLMITGALSMMLYLDWEFLRSFGDSSPILIVVIELSAQASDLFTKIREAIASVNAHLAEQLTALKSYSSSRRAPAGFASQQHLRDACTRSNIYDLALCLCRWFGLCLVAILLGGSGAIAQSGLPFQKSSRDLQA